MIEIGNMPILWHIMKEYSYYGFHDFVICAGYKQHMIKEWFAGYFLHTSDITFDFTRGQNEMIVHNHHTEPWTVTVVDHRPQHDDRRAHQTHSSLHRQ